MISPIFPYVSKNQILQLIPEEKKESIDHLFLKASAVFSAVWIPCNTAFLIIGTTPTLVISFTSTVLGYYAMYFLPVIISFKVGNYVASSDEPTKEL